MVPFRLPGPASTPRGWSRSWFFVASCLGPREPFGPPSPEGTCFAVTPDFQLWGEGKRASLGNRFETRCGHRIFCCVALGSSVSLSGSRMTSLL